MTAEEWDQMTGWSQDQADNAYVTTAVLTAIEAAEAEAREVLDSVVVNVAGQGVRRIVTNWAEDRLRLCARDRAALARHAPTAPEHGPLCLAHDEPTGWPCGVAESVIAYWQGETP